MAVASHAVPADAYYLAGYLRVASVAVALYDFLETLPTTRRFYKQQWQMRRLTTSGILFFLIQTFSIIVIFLSNFGFFYRGFSDSSCRRFYFLPPIFKVVQLMISQAILAIRVFNLSRRSVKMGVILVTLFIVASILEWITNLYGRISAYDPTWGNCRGIPEVGTLGTWICYAVAIVYDLTVTGISVVYLLQHHLSISTGLMSRLTRIMIYDGVFYFVVLTGVNVFNLILYHSTEDLRTAASSLGFCMTWIMSQRLLIHLHNASLQRRNESINQAVTITQTIESQRQISEAMRSQFEPKSDYNFQLTIPDFDLSTLETGPELPEDTGVEVRIERTFKVDRRRVSYSLENYSRSTRS